MNTWLCIPSCRPAAVATTCLDQWRAQGYRIALLRQGELIAADFCIATDHYLGWAASTNALIREVMQRDPEAEWFVGGGDDYAPDLSHKAEEIAEQCNAHFTKVYWAEILKNGLDLNVPVHCVHRLRKTRTFGVMQPTGDRWGANEPWALTMYPDAPAYIDRICGSPWMGREFCRRMYQGRGPLWEGFHHMYADEHLQCVAQKLGVFWQRRDLIQMHHHWGRKAGGATRDDIPDFARHINSKEHWDESKAIFDRLKAGGFAEAEDQCL